MGGEGAGAYSVCFVRRIERQGDVPVSQGERELARGQKNWQS